jgi:hypothetical protein
MVSTLDWIASPFTEAAIVADLGYSTMVISES